jgi:hypothetical protein
MQSSVAVPATGNFYFAVTALKNTIESNPSNEICRAPVGAPCTQPSPTPSPSPSPSPSPTTALGIIEGFSLWNAATDTVLDADFRTGDKISLATHGTCVAIEIRSNAYLDLPGPGSVMTNFDGGAANGCTQAGVTHENNPPYGWEDDEGLGKFACAASLAVPGTHTLTGRPFNGDDCTGIGGTSVTVQFEVVDDRGSTSSPPPLGPPGRPFLIE